MNDQTLRNIRVFDKLNKELIKLNTLRFSYLIYPGVSNMKYQDWSRHLVKELKLSFKDGGYYIEYMNFGTLEKIRLDEGGYIQLTRSGIERNIALYSIKLENGELIEEINQFEDGIIPDRIKRQSYCDEDLYIFMSMATRDKGSTLVTLKDGTIFNIEERASEISSASSTRVFLKDVYCIKIYDNYGYARFNIRQITDNYFIDDQD